MVNTALTLAVILGGGAVAPIVLDPFLPREAKRPASALIALLALVATLLVAGFQVFTLLTGGAITTVGGVLVNDLAAAFFTVVVVIVSLSVVVASYTYMEREGSQPAYYSLILFTTLGMVLLAHAVDILVIIIAWELMSIPTFVLAGFIKRDPLSNEAAIKLFLLAALSSAIILYGASLAFGLAASTKIVDIVAALTSPTPQTQLLALASASLLIAGFGLKLSIVPFHMWMPDTCEGAPNPIATLLAAASKKAGFAVVLRVFLALMPFARLDLAQTFAVLALLGMTFGNIAALTQRSITRLLAYSSIAQVGYILIGLAVAGYTPLGPVGALYHIFNHAVMKGTAFLAAGAVIYRLATTDLEDYRGLGRRMPATALALTIALLALAGIPPLNGFWSKLVLFAAAVEGGMAWLAVAGALNSALSLGYYAWIVKRMYLDEGEGGRVQEPLLFALLLGVLALIIVATGLYPAPFYAFSEAAAKAIGG
jgi:NADH-quinone oxidoreductase subunit N